MYVHSLPLPSKSPLHSFFTSCFPPVNIFPCTLLPLAFLLIPQLATLHLQRGEKAEAVKYYRRTLELDPTYKLALHNLAVLKQERQEPAELEEAIQL